MSATATPTARRRLTRWGAVAALLVVGCQETQPQGPAGTPGQVAVTVHTGFTTQAVQGNVDHYVASLYNGSGTRMFETTITSGTWPSGSRTILFNNALPGSYKAMVEAFGSAGDTYTISDPKSSESTGTAVVSDTGSSNTQNLTVNLKLVDAGPLAGDDASAPHQVHGYSTIKNSVTSQWVWIPVFHAYTLINPGNCGSRMRFSTADSSRPSGYWVGSAPSSGTPGVDWQDHVFGGFYAGKYEASRQDAANGTAGSSTELSVRATVTPWTGVTWLAASATCRNYRPECYLISDREWTSLAVWSQIHNLPVYGNTDTTFLRDAENTGTTFSNDSAHGSGRALTGSGGATTSHDGTVNGVHDLKGNVAEWTSEVESGTNWVIRDVPTGTALPSTGGGTKILAMFPSNRLVRFGLPSALDGTGKAEFGFDGYTSGSVGNPAVRGGRFDDGAAAGIWHISLANSRISSYPFIGFRPVLRF